MRILIVHNEYKEKGGEDNVFESEYHMLKDAGHEVRKFVCENNDISSVKAILQLSYKLFYNTSTVDAVQEIIDDFSPDIIHVHNFFYILSPSVFFVAKKNNIPIILTVHNYRLICAGAYLLRDGKVCETCVTSRLPIQGVIHKCHRSSHLQSAHLISMIMFHKWIGTWSKKVTKYLVLTDFAKEKLVNSNLRINAHQVAIKPNCVSDSGYSNMEDRSDYFLFVGRLSQEKGIDLLINAFSKSKKKIIIIGTGPLAGKVIEASKNFPNIQYDEFKDNELIIEYLKKCKALIFPSIWYEGMPRTILEAFSTGTPVISTDIDNINKIVINNHNGLHFKNNSAESLTEKIEQFSKLPNVKELYINARSTFEEKYSFEINQKMLLDIYHEVLGYRNKNNKSIEETKV